MSTPKSPFIANLVPFFVAGITIALMIGMLVIFSYLLFWGVLIGAVLWLVITIKNKFFPSKNAASVDASTEKNEGRTIEHDDIKD